MLARLSKRIKGRGEKADGWNEKKTIDGQVRFKLKLLLLDAVLPSRPVFFHADE